MNNAVLIQHASGPYVRLLQEFAPWYEPYCDRWGMDYVCYTPDRPMTEYQSVPHPMGIMWERYTYIMRAMEKGYDYIFYLDADAVIVDRGIDLRAALPDNAWLGMGHEGNWFQAGVQYIRVNQKSVAFYHYLTAFWDNDANDEVSINGAIGRLQPWHWETVGLHPAWHSISQKGASEECVVRAFHMEGDAENRLALMRDIVARRGR